MNVATKEPDLQEQFPDTDYDDENEDDGERVGWLLVSEGEQVVLPHPEDKTHAEVIEAFATARKKKHDVMVLGRNAFDPMEVSLFVWSEDVQFPEMEKFDALQERMEVLLAAQAELSQNQAAMQQAQEQLFQEELEDLGQQAMQEALAQSHGAGAPQNDQSQAGTPKARKTFRPPA